MMDVTYRDKGEAGGGALSFQRNKSGKRCRFSRTGNAGQEQGRISMTESMLRGDK